MIQLRPYQEENVKEIFSHYQDGKKSVLLRAPTGYGKTVVFCHIIRVMTERFQKAFGRACRVNILAHRGELLEQCGRKLNELRLAYGMIAAGFPLTLHLPVQASMVQTLRKRQHIWGRWVPDMVVVDEAHLAKADSYMMYLEYIRQINPNVLFLFVTATPIRLDGKGFDDVCEVMVEGPQLYEMVQIGRESGWTQGLVMPETIQCLSPDMTGSKKVGGDYSKKEVEERTNTKELIGNIVKTYLEMGQGRKGLVFSPSVAHAKSLTDEFNRAGVSAEWISGELASDDRRGVLHRLKTGETRMVLNCSVLCEGFDEPSISYVALARPTLSLALYHQQAGRGLRLHPESGKVDCIIADHAGLVDQHGNVLAKAKWGLDGTYEVKEEYVDTRRVCHEHKRISEDGVMFSCGFDDEIKQTGRYCEKGELCPFQRPRVTSTEIVYQEIQAEMIHVPFRLPDEPLPDFLKRLPPTFIFEQYIKLLQHAAQKNYKDGWAWHKVVTNIFEKIGVSESNEVKNLFQTYVPYELSADVKQLINDRTKLPKKPLTKEPVVGVKKYRSHVLKNRDDYAKVLARHGAALQIV